ncbi:MAG TPA: hypothetical protein VFM54_21515, partial [Micromonosporaceae bacterium]|nr:hypothetical protein [Micromonosporaceae bacterium]
MRGGAAPGTLPRPEPAPTRKAPTREAAGREAPGRGPADQDTAVREPVRDIPVREAPRWTAPRGNKVRAAAVDRPQHVERARMGAAMDRWRAGARTELRRQLREAQRMRQITLVALVLLVLGAYPLYLATQVASRDPVFNAL